MQNKRHEQQYNGNRHQSTSFKGENSKLNSSRDQDRNFSGQDSGRYDNHYNQYGQSARDSSSPYDTDYNTSDRTERAGRSESQSRYNREDYLSDYSRPYSEGVASYSRPYSSDSSYLNQDQGSGYRSNNGVRSEYSSQRDTVNSHPHQQSYGQGQYSAMSNTDRGVSRKEGYGQYPQQNWKNTNEGQWQTSSSQDSSSSKSYFGKGPKGFKRSDERIKEEVCEALFHDHHIDASEIDVTVQNGEITLSGTVTERRMKRLAEDCVEAISGVTDVKNEIKVQSSTSDKFGSDDATYADKNMDRNDKTKNRTGASNKVM